jgi:hypothetical protein
MDKFRVKDHAQGLVGYSNIIMSASYDVDEDGNEYEDTYGIRVVEQTFDNVKVEDGKLLMDDMEVSGYEYYTDMNKDLLGKIPSRFLVRYYDVRRDNYPAICCGLDLLSNGMFWVGLENGIYFDSITEALRFIKKHCASNNGTDSILITLEEPM